MIKLHNGGSLKPYTELNKPMKNGNCKESL